MVASDRRMETNTQRGALPDITWVVKSQIIVEKYVADMEDTERKKVLFGETKWQTLLGTSSRIWEDNIKTNLT
jgi:hypothetical protein